MKRVSLIGIVGMLAAIGIQVSQAQQPGCKSGGNTANRGYMERPNDRRCEGTNAFRKSGGPDLVSFSTGQLQPSNQQLALQVPKLANLPTPRVIVRSYVKYYQLIPLGFPRSTASLFGFQWSTSDVIGPEQIPYSSLMATAFARDRNRLVYLPVIFNQPSDRQYRFVLSSERPFMMKAFEIRDSQGKIVHRKSAKTYDPGEVTLTWDGRGLNGKSAAPGRYVLRIQTQLQQPPEDISPTRIEFEHNPEWLK